MTSYFTPAFLFVFFPASVVMYTITPKRWRWVTLLFLSYTFVALISKFLIVFLFVTTLVTYALGRGMGTLIATRDAQLAETQSEKKKIKTSCKRRMKALLVVGIIVGFGILIALKYLAFFSEIATSALGTFGIEAHFKVWRIGVTIGISFYTLMAVSYLIDVYRETIPADKHLGRVALFLCFFPQIMEGPICRYGQTATALWTGEDVKTDNLRYGALRIIVGLVKKLVIADRLNLFVKPVFENYANYDGGIIALAAILYTVQLYCDFAGCMDVGIGVARIFNVNLPENFRQPFFSKTASEFWQRWHITLGTWFRDYIYYPVSLSKPIRALTSKARKRFGNRYGPILTGSIALFCVWLGNGLWHGAGSQYVAFGMYYFVLILLGGLIDPLAHELASRLGIDRECLPYKLFRIARTLIVIFVGELIFRSTSFSASLAMLSQIATGFTLESFANGTLFTVGLELDGFALGAADFALVAIGFTIIIACDIAKEHDHNIIELLANGNALLRWTVFIVLVMVIVIFGAYGYGYAPVDPLYAHF